MKTTKYISVILLFLIISCTNDSGFDLIEIPTIEPKFGVNTYATINDYKTVEGIELEVNTTKELRLMHGNPENITDEVDGLITWQYLSDGIGFEVNASTDIIEKVYLYTTLYQDYANNYIYQIQEDLAGILLGTMKITQVVDNIDSTIIPVNGTIQEATGGEVNGVYYYDYEGIGRFIYISDSIDNKEGLVVQIILGAVDAVVSGNSSISFDETGDNTQTFNVGSEDTDNLNASILTFGGTGVLAENKNFIGVATAEANDDGATGIFTFELTTNSDTAIDAILNLELAKRAKGSVSGTVSVTGYPDTPFSYAATSTVDGGSAPAIDFEFASTISLVSSTPLTVTIKLNEMLTEGNTTTPIFRLSKVTLEKGSGNPINPNNISFDTTGDNSQTFNVGSEESDDLNASIIEVGGTGILVENKKFIGVATVDASDNGATAVFTFDLTTNSAAAINTNLKLVMAKRQKGSVSGTVSVEGYPDQAFSFAKSSDKDSSTETINIEYESQIELSSSTPHAVTITLNEMLTEGNTTTPIFRLEEVIVEKDGNAPVTPAKDTWLDADNSISDLTLSTDCTGCSVTTVANPDATDAEATNVTKWNIASTSGKGNKSLSFDFKDGKGVALADYANLKVSVRMYWPSFNDISNYDSNKRFRLYLSDGTNSQQVQINLVESNEAGWHTVEFDFSALTSTLEGDVVSGEFRLIGNKFTNIDNGLEFYIDTITSNL